MSSNFKFKCTLYAHYFSREFNTEQSTLLDESKIDMMLYLNQSEGHNATQYLNVTHNTTYSL